MKYDIRRTSQFKKDFNQIVKRGLDTSKFVNVLNLLVDGAVLPEKYKDHPLQNSKE